MTFEVQGYYHVIKADCLRGICMKYEKIYLKDLFPELGNNDCNAYVECYIPTNCQNAGEKLLKKKSPAMVVCPGGGYNMTSDREAEPIALQFLSEGYRTFVVRYSVKPHCFPQQLREVAAVMELIYSNAEEWNIDVTRIGIIGFSAGGHLAAQYSNRFDCPEVRELFPESKPVQASILSYAVITSHPDYKHEASIRHYVGHAPTEINEKGCSCELIVSDKTPPTFLWHTAEDQMVPVENSLLYASALRKYKIPFELHVYPYGAHGLATADELTCDQLDERQARANKWIEDAKSWLKIQGF